MHRAFQLPGYAGRYAFSIDRRNKYFSICLLFCWMCEKYFLINFLRLSVSKQNNEFVIKTFSFFPIRNVFWVRCSAIDICGSVESGLWGGDNMARCLVFVSCSVIFLILAVRFSADPNRLPVRPSVRLSFCSLFNSKFEFSSGDETVLQTLTLHSSQSNEVFSASVEYAPLCHMSVNSRTISYSLRGGSFVEVSPDSWRITKLL